MLLVAGLLAIAAPSASAQTPVDSLTAGLRIRLRAPEAGVPWRTTGVLDSVAAGTVYVRDLRDPPAVRGARLTVPLRSVESLEVSVGRRSRWSRAGRGALWGLAVYGVLAGAYIIQESTTCEGADCFGGGFAWIGLAGAVPWAAGIGAVTGFALPVERWRRVHLR